MIISNRPKQLNRRSSVTRMSIDEKEKLVHSSSMEERGTALTDRITEDSEQGKIVVFIEERHVNSGIIFSCFGNTQWCFYNTQSKSYCLFNTQSRVLQYCIRRQLLTFKVPIAQMKLRCWMLWSKTENPSRIMEINNKTLTTSKHVLFYQSLMFHFCICYKHWAFLLLHLLMAHHNMPSLFYITVCNILLRELITEEGKETTTDKTEEKTPQVSQHKIATV